MFADGVWMGGYMWLFWVLLIVVVLVLIKAFSARPGADSGARPESPLEVLKTRYARGEIDEEEFHRRRSELEK